MEPSRLRFINEKIVPHFEREPTLEKKPGCPDGFIWRGEYFAVIEVLSEWHDYERRGKSALNMRPAHARVARVKGSWGVGKDNYRVKTGVGRVFEIYYDRAPKSSDERKGEWFLDREIL
jgi:hypothetical protein